MDLNYTPAQHAFRQEVRAWLHAHVPRQAFASYDTREGFEQHRQWEATLAEGIACYQSFLRGLLDLAPAELVRPDQVRRQSEGERRAAGACGRVCEGDAHGGGLRAGAQACALEGADDGGGELALRGQLRGRPGRPPGEGGGDERQRQERLVAVLLRGHAVVAGAGELGRHGGHALRTILDCWRPIARRTDANGRQSLG